MCQNQHVSNLSSKNMECARWAAQRHLCLLQQTWTHTSLSALLKLSTNCTRLIYVNQTSHRYPTFSMQGRQSV